MAGGRYRWRTWLRVHLPYRFGIYKLVRKGKHDCGDHEWFRIDDVTMGCFHCVVVRDSTEDEDADHWLSTMDLMVDSPLSDEDGRKVSWRCQGPGEAFVAGFGDSYQLFIPMGNVYHVRDLGPEGLELNEYADWDRLQDAGVHAKDLPAEIVEIRPAIVRIPPGVLD